MAQHDYDVANASGATVRADINSALDAIVSLNSGASAPSTTFAYMWWADTTNAVLKQRDSGNTTWVVRGTLDSDRVISKTTTYTVALADYGKLVLCSASGGAFTITLPAAATAGDGFVVALKRTDSGTNVVTVDGNGAETIDGATTHGLRRQYDSIVLVSDGSNWQTMGDDVGGTVRDYTRQQNFVEKTLSLDSAGAVAWDMDDGQVAVVTLTANATLSAPTNHKAGGYYALKVIQDATGGWTLGYNAVFKHPGGSAHTTTAAANAVDIQVWRSDGTNLHRAGLDQDLK